MATQSEQFVQLHAEVLAFLLEIHQQKPDLCFSTNTTNYNQVLSQKWWIFMGWSDVSLYFWHDPKMQFRLFITTSGFTIIDFTPDLIKNFDVFTSTKYSINESYVLGMEIAYESTDWRSNILDFIQELYPIFDAAFATRSIPRIDITDFRQRLLLLHSFGANIPPTLLPAELPNVWRYKMQLQEIALKNIGNFEELTLDLSRRVTCIIGQNGSGKTNLMRAIAIGISGISPYYNPKDENSVLSPIDFMDWLRIESIDETGEKKYANRGEIILHYNVDDVFQSVVNNVGIENNNFKKRSLGSTYHLNRLQFLSIESINHADSPATELQFICPVLAFPQMAGKSKPSYKQAAYPDVTELLPIIKGEGTDKLRQFESWIDVCFFDKKQARLEPIQAVFRLLSLVISDDNASAIEFVTANRIMNDRGRADTQIIVRTLDSPNGITFDLLSQGYQNLFYWVGGIVSRLYQINEYYRQNNAAKARPTIFDMYGIILIDEIDTYLHPKWQRNILKVLAAEFRNMQFIVTTHSPLVLGNLNDWQHTRVYQVDNGKAVELQHFYGRNPIDLYFEFYGVEARPWEINFKITRMFSFIEEETLESLQKAQQLLSELSVILGDDDPIVVEANSSINLISILQS
jgi:predicted ATP-binding protein involved in virulence